MFRFVFGSNYDHLASIIAPNNASLERNYQNLFLKNLVSGKYQQALDWLKSVSEASLPLNEVDQENGLSPLHYACGSGNLELLMELLARDVDINKPTRDGDYSLHIAVVNNKKAVVEILLRSGVDPGIVNKDGKVAAELTTNNEIRQVLHRDRTSRIFSPVGLVHKPLNVVDVTSPMPVNTNTKSTSNQGDIDIKTHISTEASVIPTTLNVPIESPNVSGGKSLSYSPTGYPPAESPLNSITTKLNNHVFDVRSRNYSEADDDDDTNAVTIVGVNSVKKPAQNPNLQLFTAASSSDSNDSPVNNGGAKKLFDSPNPGKKNIPRLDLSKVPPPPSDADLAASRSATSNTSNNSGNNSGNRNDVGAATDNLISPRGVLPSVPYATPFTASPNPTAAVNQGLDEIERRNLHNAIIAAAEQTAASNYLVAKEKDKIFNFGIALTAKTVNLDKYKKLLQADPKLVKCRNYFEKYNGMLLTHIAAMHGHTKVLEVLTSEYNMSLWDVDIYGRTPLHLAAAANKDETCKYLRKKMNEERNIDPVGDHAPLDAAGVTPLKCAAIELKDQTGQALSPLIKQELFQAGDRCILPRTPMSARTGRSPWKPGHAAEAENIVFGFAENSGYCGYMEDRHCISCPVPAHPAWSLFGVFDGHSGDFVAEYLGENLPKIVNNELLSRRHALSQKSDDMSVSPALNDSGTSVDFLKDILYTVNAQVENELKENPRMKIEKGVKPFDESGSTCVVSVITSSYIAISNIGDSRAVLARKETAEAAARIDKPFTGISPRDTPVLTAVPMSTDHKVTLPEETARVLASGLTITEKGRIFLLGENGDGKGDSIAVSRSIGDFKYKQNASLPAEAQAVSAVPDITVVERSSKDAFLILATDGLWDVWTNEDVVNFVSIKLGFTSRGAPVGGVAQTLIVEACDELIAEAVRRGSEDNITVIIIVLGNPPVIKDLIKSPSLGIVTPRRTGNDSAGADSITAKLADITISSDSASKNTPRQLF